MVGGSGMGGELLGDCCQGRPKWKPELYLYDILMTLKLDLLGEILQYAQGQEEKDLKNTKRQKLLENIEL